MDPYDPDMLGIKYPKVEADLVTISHDHPDHHFAAAVEGSPIILSAPGEYEVKGVKVFGISVFHDDEKGVKRGKNTLFRIEIDKVSILHCGDLGHKLSDKELDLIDGVDILLVPVGGFFTISAQVASEVVAQVEPKIVIPMHYNEDRINQENFGQLTKVDVFLKEMGKPDITPVPKLSVTKDKLPAELTVAVLE